MDHNHRHAQQLGYCPECHQNQPALPSPAFGNCAQCGNHMMKPCMANLTICPTCNNNIHECSIFKCTTDRERLVKFFATNRIEKADASEIGLTPGEIPTVNPETGAIATWETVRDLSTGDVEHWFLRGKVRNFVIYND